MRQEVELMKELKEKSPFMVRYVDDDEDEEGISIYMEYFENTLLDLIEKKREKKGEEGEEGRFSDLEICGFIAQIAEGFVYLIDMYISFSLFIIYNSLFLSFPSLPPSPSLSLPFRLDFLHNLDPPILHRDIKSDNIFVEGEESERQLKIGDFGVLILLNISLR